jgi:hypothetical protein
VLTVCHHTLQEDLPAPILRYCILPTFVLRHRAYDIITRLSEKTSAKYTALSAMSISPALIPTLQLILKIKNVKKVPTAGIYAVSRLPLLGKRRTFSFTVKETSNFCVLAVFQTMKSM